MRTHVTPEVVVPGLGVALAVCLTALDVVLDELDILFVEAVRGIGVAAIRRLYDHVGIGDGGHKGILADYRVRHDALCLRHNAVGGARHPAVAEARAEVLPVAIDIRPADMDDRPIRPQRRHRDDLLGFANRIYELDEFLVELRNAGADAAAPGEEFLPRGSREETSIKQVFAGLHHLDLAGLRVFAVVVADWAVHFLADIRRDQLLHAAGADQQIDLEAGGRRGNDRKILFASADHLAHDRHRVIVGAETADRHRLAVLDQANGLFNRFNDLFLLLAHVTTLAFERHSLRFQNRAAVDGRVLPE